MKGVYCLLVKIPEKKKVIVGKKGVFEFEKGHYIYVGSALGPGEKSLENRINRHLSSNRGKNKNFHWHIDYLLNSENTINVKIEEIYYKETKDKKQECKTSNEIKNSGGEPVIGFGSSDCKCKSHLFFIHSNKNSLLSEITKKLGKIGFREFFAKQKFGKIPAEFSSKSLLCGETASRLI